MVQRMLAFLPPGRHSAVISQVFYLSAEKVRITVHFDTLQQIFSFVIEGIIPDQLYLAG
jgi:hypothetical protein